MNNSQNLLTGGDGRSGQTGLDARQKIDARFTAIMGDLEYILSGFTWSTSNLSGFTNKTIVIKDTFNVSTNFTLPSNITLKFEGGKILGAITITGNGSRIINHDNIQCFSLDTTIAGTWIGVKACVEWWGATSNPNITTYSNDVMPYIGKLATSGFEAHCLAGNYYVGSTLKILQPFTYTLLGNIQPFGVTKLNDGGSWTAVRNPTPSEQTTFYSNLDINWFEVESPYVNIIGGIFDISAVNPITHWCIYTCNNETVDHSHFRQVCRGVVENTKLEGQTGGYFRWEVLTGTGHTVAGHLYKVTIETECLNIPYGVNIDPVIDEYSGSTLILQDWANGIDIINSRFTGCKVGVRHMMASWANIQAIFQSGTCHAPSERGLYQLYVRGYPVIVDQFCWDLYGTEDTEYNPGYYFPALPVYSYSYGLQLQGASLVSYRLSQFRGVPPMGIGIVNEDTRVKLFRHNQYGSHISELHSKLQNFNLESGHSYTILGYQGTGYDFDDIANRLPGTATPNPNITISYPQNLLRNNGFATNYTFATGTTDYDLDFVEIVITGSINYLYYLYVHLSGEPKRIQVITLDGSNNIISPPGILNQYPVVPAYTSFQTYEFGYDNKSPVKIIIRLIGVTSRLVKVSSDPDVYVDTPYPISIQDISAMSGKNNLNFVDKHYLPMWTFHGFLNQSGTTNGVITTLINNAYNSGDVLTTYTLTWRSTGTYWFSTNLSFPTNRTMPKAPYIVYTPLGRIQVSLNGTSRYDILTYDTSDQLSNDILIDFPLIINAYW